MNRLLGVVGVLLIGRWFWGLRVGIRRRLALEGERGIITESISSGTMAGLFTCGKGQLITRIHIILTTHLSPFASSSASFTSQPRCRPRHCASYHTSAPVSELVLIRRGFCLERRSPKCPESSNTRVVVRWSNGMGWDCHRGSGYGQRGVEATL